MNRQLLLCGLLLMACNDRQAFHEPDPALSRMLEQRRGDPYAPSRVFADGKTMREPLPFTVARNDEDPDAPAPPVTRALLQTGRTSFERVCATCHGMTGDGVSVVATKIQHGNPPPPLIEDRLRAYPREKIYATVTSGYGHMPSFADMLNQEERWAVASYVKALQLSQHADVKALPAALVKELP